MMKRYFRFAGLLPFAAIAAATQAAVCWGGLPPAPPATATVPSVPVGGMGIYTVVAGGIAAYGIWKNRS